MFCTSHKSPPHSLLHSPNLTSLSPFSSSTTSQGASQLALINRQAAIASFFPHELSVMEAGGSSGGSDSSAGSGGGGGGGGGGSGGGGSGGGGGGGGRGARGMCTVSDAAMESRLVGGVVPALQESEEEDAESM